MAREFYTEKDIEDLHRRGVMSLQVTDDVVLTELAYEKARRLGIQLVSGGQEAPPAGPVRPYLSQGPLYRKPEGAPPPARQAAPQPPPAPSPAQRSERSEYRPAAPTPSGGQSDLHQRIRSAVIAKLGSQVDGGLLDAIITRVMNSTGVK